MANKVKFNMKQIPQALSEIFVRVTDLNRNELYAGVKTVSGEEVEIDLGNSGTVGAGVIIQADTFNGSNLTEFKSLSGGALVSEILSNISLSGYKFQSNGTDNYIDLGFVPDETTDMAFQVTYLDGAGKQISGSSDFGLGVSSGNLISSVNGVESTFDALGAESKSLGLLSSGLAYVDGLENGIESTVTGATLKLYAMAKNTNSADVDHCTAVWERISWYHNGAHHYIDFTEGSGSTVTDNFGNEYTIQGTVSDSQWINYEKARRVFIDTDMETDCDDVGALRVAAWAERMGYIDIVAVNMNNKTEGLNLSAAVDAVLTFEGRPNLAIGFNHSGTVIPGGSPYNAAMLEYPHTLGEDSDVEDSVDTYRRAIQSAINDGVKIDIITIGTLRSLRNFMRSLPSDGYPSGMDMLNQGVSRMYSMGGEYPSGSEFNFDANPQTGLYTKYVLDNFPHPIYFTTAATGNNVTSGGNLKDVYPDLGEDIVRDAYYYHGSEGGRRSWDPMCMYLAALTNPSQLGQDLIQGTNTANEFGANTFTADPSGNHYYGVNVKDGDYYALPLNDILAKQNWPTRDGIGKYSIPRVTTKLTITDGSLTQGVSVAGDVVCTFAVDDPHVSNITVDFQQGTNEGGYYAIANLSVVLTEAGAAYLSVGGNEMPNVSLVTSTNKRITNNIETIGTGEFARSYTQFNGGSSMTLNKPMIFPNESGFSFKIANNGSNDRYISALDHTNHDGGIFVYVSGGRLTIFAHNAAQNIKVAIPADPILAVSVDIDWEGKATLTLNGESATGGLSSLNGERSIGTLGVKGTTFTANGAVLYDFKAYGISNTEDYPLGKADFPFSEDGASNGYTYYNKADPAKAAYFTGVNINTNDVVKEI